MSWLLAYLLLFLNLSLLVFVGIYAKSWKSRVIGGILLILPVPLYLVATGYFTAYYQHVRDCKADGGLKVLIQPEKAEKVRLEGRNYDEGAAQNTLQKFHPHLKLVEAVEANSYYAYSVNFVPKDPPGVWGAFATPWKFNKVTLQGLESDIYVIYSHRDDTKSTKNRITKYEWMLTRNGKTYAKFTRFIHKWSGIQYPDAASFWSCPDSDSSSWPEDDLLKLILK